MMVHQKALVIDPISVHLLFFDVASETDASIACIISIDLRFVSWRIDALSVGRSISGIHIQVRK